MDAAREAPAELLFDRVAADPALPDEARQLVLSAFNRSADLERALVGALGDRPIPSRERPEPTVVPGVYLRSISAFAEPAELALTGANMRGSERTSVWQSAWRNLHQPTGIALGLELLVEAETRLVDAKKRLEEQAGVAKKALPGLTAAVAASSGPRAARVTALLAKRACDAAAIATVGEASVDDGRLDVPLGLHSRDPAGVEAAEAGLRAGLAAVAAEARAQDGRARELAQLLRAALAHHERAGDGGCPVCGSGELEAAWHVQTVREVRPARGRGGRRTQIISSIRHPRRPRYLIVGKGFDSAGRTDSPTNT